MYSYKFCSPSRGSFLTGRFPWRLSSTICDGQVCNYLPSHIPMGINVAYSMLPKRLAEGGYISHHVGKWHEGLYAPAFTPMYRGFNSSNGFLTGGEDHYTLVGDTGLGNCGVPKGPAMRDVYPASWSMLFPKRIICMTQHARDHNTAETWRSSTRNEYAEIIRKLI